MSKTWAISGVDLHLDLDPHRPRGSLETALREAVRDGRLAAGTRIPPSRALAADLGIARNTVAEAYAQLVAEGWLLARQGSGTRVGPRSAAPTPAGRLVQPTTDGPRYDLRPGRPDVNAFPRRAWTIAARHALAGAGAGDLDYTDPAGLVALRLALTEHLSRARGVRVEPERVLVCAGFTQALSLIGQVLVDRGVRRVAVEAYGITEHRDLLTRRGLDLVGVPVDTAGLSTPDLTGLDARAALVTPAHQFPLGSVLGPQRRADLVAWARSRDGWVIEDDYDGEFRFDRRPVGALQALDPDRVIYTGTASKTLAPGLRLAWLVAPPALLDDLVTAKRAQPAQNSALDQLTLAQLITSGEYDRHVRRSRLNYRRRRDRLLAVLAREVPQCRVSGIAAGLHVVISLPPGHREEETVARARDCGLVVLSLAEFALGRHDLPPGLVVGFGAPAEHAFDTAVARLVAALRH